MTNDKRSNTPVITYERGKDRECESKKSRRVKKSDRRNERECDVGRILYLVQLYLVHFFVPQTLSGTLFVPLLFLIFFYFFRKKRRKCFVHIWKNLSQNLRTHRFKFTNVVIASATKGWTPPERITVQDSPVKDRPEATNRHNVHRREDTLREKLHWHNHWHITPQPREILRETERERVWTRWIINTTLFTEMDE